MEGIGGAEGLKSGTGTGMHQLAHGPSLEERKSLHKHFDLKAAIYFIALSVYYAQAGCLSTRICLVSFSSIDF